MGVKENTQLSKVDGQDEVDELEEVELERERKAPQTCQRWNTRPTLPDQGYQGQQQLGEHHSSEDNEEGRSPRCKEESKKLENSIHVGLNINY